MPRNYKEVRGILIRKYRSILGKYIWILEENGVQTKITVGKAIYEKAGAGTRWTVGHIDGPPVNLRPGACDAPEE